MVFGLGCQRERLYKPLYVVHVFILAGVVYYYFQGSVGKPAPDHEIAGEPSQLVGESLRPVWGPMDKCYPVTTQVGKGWGPPGCGALAWAPWVGTERRCSREGPPAAHSCESLSCLLLQRRRVKSEKKPASEENTQVRKETAVYASGKTAGTSLPNLGTQQQHRHWLLSGPWPWGGAEEAPAARCPSPLNIFLVGRNLRPPTLGWRNSVRGSPGPGERSLPSRGPTGHACLCS
nr:uncharacterized protein LOC112934003 isoform X4 [Vulpes vulpes]